MATIAQHAPSEDLAEELLASDAAYFRAAAEVEELQGFRIAWMTGLCELAAACVVHRVSPDASIEHSLPLLERRIAELGFKHARIYQQHPDTAMQALLARLGYCGTLEIAMIDSRMDDHGGGDSASATLEPVASEADWAAKFELHREIARGPDGHASPARAWLEMERKKCAAGYMTPYLIVREDRVCGAVSFAPAPRIGRLKNIVIHPRWRRKGIGEKACRLIARMAKTQGKSAAGCFAISGGDAVNMYQNAGYRAVAQQIEWYRELDCTR